MAIGKAIGFASLVASGLLAGCGSNGEPQEDLNVKPAFLGTVTSTRYDGGSDDLLTAGLGTSGLQSSAPPPGYANAANPTAAELRKNAIYNNYRALVDPTAAGGFGTFFGPGIDNNGNATLGEGKIAGDEYIAYSDDGTGRINVTLMVQIPTGFNTGNPCIVTATSSGSRGVYGAIGTAGDWGLKQGCAVAYTDKGSGIGYHNLQTDTVTLQDGRRAPAATAGTASNFTAPLTLAALGAFNAAFPNRVAVKQAHSEQNSEQDWGTYTLQAVEFAFWVLNEKFGEQAGSGAGRLRTYTPDNTIVIASSASNGGGAAILAAEQDTEGLIDGVAVSEPVTEVSLPAGVRVRRNGTQVTSSGLHLFDTMTIGNLYQPCAAHAPALAQSPLLSLVDATIAENRCTALAARGLVDGTTFADRAADALAKLREAGWEPETDLLHASHYGLGNTTGLLAAFYANMYGKFSVTDNICGYSLGTTTAITASNEASWFGAGNGLTGAGFGLLNNNSVGGAASDLSSVTPSTGVQDFNIDGAICLRNLATGTDITTDAPLTSTTTPTLAQSARVQAGMEEVLRSGDLGGRPAIIVHGRSDALVPVNHNSRAYFALNKSVEGAASKLSYIEILNANHFDAFNAIPGYDTRMVPIHLYHLRAMNAMWAHLTAGAALPPSQVVRTSTRASTAIPLSATMVPAISAAPAVGDRITFASNTMDIPN